MQPSRRKSARQTTSSDTSKKLDYSSATKTPANVGTPSHCPVEMHRFSCPSEGDFVWEKTGMDGWRTGTCNVSEWDKVGCEVLLLACNTEPLRCILRAQCHVYYYDVFERQSTIILCSDAKSSCCIHACKILIGRPVESVYNRDLRLI